MNDRATVEFTSAMQYGSGMEKRDWTEVRDEPMMFGCRGDFAWENGGEITREFITNVMLDADLTDLTDIIVDSRSHMLKKGWFPCIPGFHHDDVPRLCENGQPWYWEFEARWDSMADGFGDENVYDACHAFALVGDDVCRTEFALGTTRFTIPNVRETLYKVWHPEVVEAIQEGRLESVPAPMNQVVLFDARTWHQGTPAVSDGWRWFGRASWQTGRLLNCENQIRPQVQVYLENPMEGW